MIKMTDKVSFANLRYSQLLSEILLSSSTISIFKVGVDCQRQ